MSQKLTLPVLLSCLIFLIVYPHETASCVSETLILWYQNVLPALLPALLLVNLILNIKNDRLPTQLLCVSVGLLCGFPLGCQYVCESVRQGRLSKEKGQVYAACFNQFSPVFLSSYAAISILKMPVKTVLCILYISQLLVFLPCYIRAKKKEQTIHNTQNKEKKNTGESSLFSLLDQAIVNASDTLVKIGGYMLVCSLLRIMLQKLLPNQTLLCILAGFLETTSGIAFISSKCSSQIIMRTLVFGFTAFGGICGILQVSRPLNAAGLSRKKYVCIKVATGILAAALFLLFQGLQRTF